MASERILGNYSIFGIILAGLEKKRIASYEDRKTVAYHECGHAVVSWFLEGGQPLLKVFK
jgi:AFG3 family protein